jgi:Prokaryotic Cytochrome C oxidase subunit IV
MSALLAFPATRAWLVLMLAAVLSWSLTESVAAARVGTIAVVLIAAFKIRLVVVHFMELQWQHRPWRIIFELWILGITAIIIGGYWMATK